MVNFPEWLRLRLARMAESGWDCYVVPAPAAGDPEIEWDQSNSSGAMRRLLTGAGFQWAVPHTFRRTVATLLHEGGTPIAASPTSSTLRPGAHRAGLPRADLGGDSRDLGALL
jgi:integrase